MTASLTISRVWERKHGAIVFVEPCEVKEHTNCDRKESNGPQLSV